jgi:hypothetical protein
MSKRPPSGEKSRELICEKEHWIDLEIGKLLADSYRTGSFVSSRFVSAPFDTTHKPPSIATNACNPLGSIRLAVTLLSPIESTARFGP